MQTGTAPGLREVPVTDAGKTTDARASTATDNTRIRSFRVHVPDEELAELRRRIAATNWPEKETVADQSQGVPLTMLQKLAR
jgi:Epoxide hydrolase N terminus